VILQHRITCITTVSLRVIVHYIGQGGCVFAFFCLSVCQQVNSKCCRRILMTYFGGVTANKRLDFGDPAVAYPGVARVAKPTLNPL